MALMQWHIVSRDQYAAGTPKDIDLYFITGENVIYRGTELFTKSMEFYADALPASPAPNRIYVNSTTLEGKMWDGTAWKQVIRPLDSTVTETGANAVTGAAVHAFVKTQIEAITGAGAVLTGAEWDADNKVLTFKKGDKSTDITLTLDGLGTKLTYATETGTLSLVDASNNELAKVELGLEKFVKSGEYDEATKSIILYFNDEKTDKVTIPASGLVDTYTAENSATVNLEVAANVFKAAVNISKAENNALTAKEDGLYVEKVDISGKMDKDTDAVKDNIAIFDENGNAVDSGKSFEDIASNVQIFTGVDQTIEEATTGKTPKTGDFLILKKTISEGKFEHTAWKQVIRPLDSTVTETGANAVTGAAVHAFVKTQIEAITGAGAVLTGAEWDADNKVLTFKKGDKSTDITLTLDGLGTKLTYATETGTLSLVDASNNEYIDRIIILTHIRRVKNALTNWHRTRSNSFITILPLRTI